MMRLVLVDYARTRKRERLKREALMLDTEALGGFRRNQYIEELDAALDRLAKLDERQARIVELRYFGGLTIEETAGILKISPKTVKRDWTVARTWLHAELAKGRE